MGGTVTSLLVWKVITSLFDEAVLVAVVLWGLPYVGVELPLWVLAPASIALGAYNVFTYRKTVKALQVRPVPGLSDMVGSQGQAVDRLNPAGHVRIRGELWAAEVDGDDLRPGTRIVVVSQKGLKLVVRGDGQAVEGQDRIDSNRCSA